jgi:zinc protease
MPHAALLCGTLPASNVNAMAKMSAMATEEIRSHIRTWLPAIAVMAVLSFGVAGATASDRAGVTQFILANGLEVVVIPDRRAPVVTHMIWYKVGAADESPGKSGLAHFLEHLMFKGTAVNPAGRFSQVVATIGGQENAFTSNDYTGYFQRVPSERLKTVMEFEADRMTGLVLTDDVVLPERDVILEEQNLRVANNPGARLGEQMDAALYLNHPYGKPVIGWRHEMETLNREDAIAFYRRFYGPANAVVVIAGDVEPDRIRALAQATYGKIERRTAIETRKRPQEPPPVAERSITMADPRAEQPSVRRNYLVPSFATAKPGTSEALEVLAHILGGGSNSRLYQALVVQKRIAVSAGAWYQGSALDQTKFGVYGAPQPNIALPQIAAEIDAVIEELIRNGVTAEELARAKTREIADALYARDSQASMARWFGSALTTGATVADVQSWPDRIKTVTAADVQGAARQWLDKRRSVTGFLIKGPAKPVEKKS